MPMRHQIATAVFALGLALAACDPVVDQQSSTGDPRCNAPTSAVIVVYDGTLVRQSGCDEPSGVSFPAGSPLTCTVPAGTSVIFMYEGQGTHQIVPTGTPGFIPSAVSQIIGDRTITEHVACLPTAGTYDFKDNYETDVTGQLIAR